MEARTTTGGSDFLAPLLSFALRRPGWTLAIVLFTHLVVWTALPLFTASNLELDLAEDLALGKEWQLGYWKHPPLPWWIADLFYRVSGQIEIVYVLGPLSVIACFAAVYMLARDIAGPVQALIATLSLVGIHYYNYSAVKFAHDQMQLPFWALTGLFFYRALARGRGLDWMLAGAMLALAFWSKYAAFALAVSLAAFLLFDPLARRTLRTPGPYLMAAAFCVVIAPNAWWLVQSGFLPLHYVEDRAAAAEAWYLIAAIPVVWTLTQAFFIHPTLILLGVTLFPRVQKPEPQPPSAAFARRYVTMLALGPFTVVMLAAFLSGRMPVAMWGYPLFSFVPLAAILWFGPVVDPRRMQIFAVGAIFLFLLGPAIYVGTYVGEQYWRKRPKAAEFPGQALAEQLTKEWRDVTGTNLRYVAGTESVANNIAVYSPDRPHVVVHGRPQISPWINMDDLRKHGVLLAWDEGEPFARFDEWRKTFGASGKPTLLKVPRQTRRPTDPVRVHYLIVPPANPAK